MGTRIHLAILVILLQGACSSGNGSGGDPDGGPASDADVQADAWLEDLPSWMEGRVDEGFEVEGLRGFYLVGNDLTPGQDRIEVVVTAPAGVDRVDAWIDRQAAGPLAVEGGAFRLEASIADLGPGEHALVLSADASERAFAGLVFLRTHPLYVVVTNDWDDPDNDISAFIRQEELHEWHPELRLTHFVGPYTFTDPGVSETRRAAIVDWLLGMRDGHDDEIGLHIHPYCSFVESAGLECLIEPSYAYSTGDDTGYAVFLTAYDEEQTQTLLERADAIFEERGLGRPTGFRAGGWTADLHTLRALGRAGFVADTSAANWSRLEEWEGYPGASLYEWNRDQWASIDETSQPYYPSETDILGTEPPVIPVLEVPDNGLLVDYVTAEEMIEVFGANWPGGALAEPRQVSIGYHPPNFSVEFQTRIHGALEHADRFLASRGEGPVVYATLSELVLVWPRPE
jgi:hypothetical protein